MKAAYILIPAAAALIFGAVYVPPPGNPVRDWWAALSAPKASLAPRAAREKREAARVVAAPVAQADVPIYLSGIGTVTPYNKVDIKAQVDGVILRLNFAEGDDVKVGDSLVSIDPAPYEARVLQWQAAKERATAQLENAKANLWRDKQLLQKDFATQKQTDAETALVGQYTADIAEAEAQIKFAQTQLNSTTITSSINGRTGIRHVDAGNLVRAADNVTIVTVVQTKPIQVIITVPAKALAQAGISPGLAELPVIAYGQEGVAVLDRGKIEMVDNTVDPATGTIKLKAVFANEASKLWPGDFVDCKIVVENRRDGLTVPSIAIQHGPKGDFVWVIRPDNTVEPRPVRVRQTLGETALIDRGLQADEQVVAEGQYYLRTGTRVVIVPELPSDKSDVSSTE